MVKKKAALSKRSPQLSFEVDKLTRSIENVVTGDSFQTVLLPLTKEDLKNVTKRTAGSSTGNVSSRPPADTYSN
jgi:hypothetical protein